MSQLDIELIEEKEGSLFWNDSCLINDHEYLTFNDYDLQNIWNLNVAKYIVQQMESNDGGIQNEAYELARQLLTNSHSTDESHSYLIAAGVTNAFISGLQNERELIQSNSLAALCNVVFYSKGDTCFVIKNKLWYHIIACIQSLIDKEDYYNYWEDIETGCLLLSNICADPSQMEGIKESMSIIWEMERQIVVLFYKVAIKLDSYVHSDLCDFDDEDDEKEMCSLYKVLANGNRSCVWNFEPGDDKNRKLVIYQAFANVLWLNNLPQSDTMICLRDLIGKHLCNLDLPHIKLVFHQLNLILFDAENMFDLPMKINIMQAIIQFAASFEASNDIFKDIFNDKWIFSLCYDKPSGLVGNTSLDLELYYNLMLKIFKICAQKDIPLRQQALLWLHDMYETIECPVLQHKALRLLSHCVTLNPTSVTDARLFCVIAESSVVDCQHTDSLLYKMLFG